jgi:DNA-binding SARP family transcriptional activator/WD40 repeat protein
MLIGLLGALEIDGRAAALSPRDRVVLSALAVRRDRAMSAEELAEALWPDGPPASWAKVVQGCISRLRRVLGADTIQTTGRGYRLGRDRYRLDVAEFEAASQRGRESTAADLPDRAVSSFDQALALWRGRPYPDLEEWDAGRLEAARLRELRLAIEEERLSVLIDAGKAGAAVEQGTVLVGEEPWRERRWAALALAQYQCDRQAEALATIRRARQALGEKLGLDPGSDLVLLERAILNHDPSLAADRHRAAAPTCPWRGLASWEATDHELFFGRERDVETCLARLESHPLLALVGQSGSGKSSLMKAGLVPVLEAMGRHVAVFVPGAQPAQSFALALASSPPGQDPVLCIDQFEEVFRSRLDADGVRQFLDAVADYAVSRAPVVLTLRADHLTDLAVGAELTGLVEQGLHLVAPLSGGELRSAVEGPARVAGLRLEAGLVDLVMRDAEHQPGALPLLSHALAETWARREGPTLTVEGYRDSGGMEGAVASSAERLCARLTAEELAQLRWLMLRMSALPDTGDPVRVPVASDVVADDPVRSNVTEMLVLSRLVTSDASSYQLAHEALVRAWPRLRRWLDEDRAGQRLWHHLALAASEWDDMGRPDGELYSGVRLEAAQQWLDSPTAEPTALEREFLTASVDRTESERRALQERAGRDRRLNRRLRGLLAAAVALLLAAVLTGVLAVQGGRDAARGRDQAEAAEARARHEALVDSSLGLRSSNRGAAALLAVEAYRQRPDALAMSALLGSLTESPGFLGYGAVPYDYVQGAPVPGTSRAVIAQGDRVREVDMDTGELGPPFENPIPATRAYSVVKVSGDGRRAAQLVFNQDQLDRCGSYERLVEDDGKGCTLLTVFDLASRRPVLGPVQTPFSGGDLAINHTGSRVAVAGGFDGDLVTYDLDTGHRSRILPGLPRPDGFYNVRDTAAVTFAGDSRLLLGSMRGPVRVVDADSMRVRRTVNSPLGSSHNFLAPAGNELVVGTGDRGVVALDLRTGRQRWFTRFGADEGFGCQTFALAETSRQVFCGDSYGHITVRSLTNGQLTGENRDTQTGEVGDLAVTGGTLVALGRGYWRWRLDGTGPVATLVADGSTSQAGYDPSGRYLEVSPRGQSAHHRIVEPSTGRTVYRYDPESGAAWVAAGVVLFQRAADDSLQLVDVSTGARRPVRGVPGHDVTAAFPGSTDRAWLFRWDRNGEAGRLVEIDVTDGRPTGRSAALPSAPFSASAGADGDTLFAAYWTGGNWVDRSDESGNVAALLDLRDRGRRQLVGGRIANGTMSADGRIVGGDYLGRLTEYSSDLKPVTSLPDAFPASSLTFSADGSRLLATSDAGVVQLYDTAGWTPLGRITSASLGPDAREGWLRPDGQAVLVNGSEGLIEWNLAPQQLMAAACEVAGRNLTAPEWNAYLPGEDYRVTCSQFPAG